MSLMKLFNFNYLKQNFKKSKVILSIFIGLIPILNVIILMMNYNRGIEVFKFNTISIINYIGIYILPIIVSICLFNYIYKKNSVDFINSMPISRKSVFITNTIFGAMIFFFMLVVNVILMLLLTLIFNIYIPITLLLDYLVYWFCVYLFTYSATNLAMSISGNAITQIVVTMLIVFLLPFTDSYMNALVKENNNTSTYIDCSNNKCIVNNYKCFNDIDCKQDLDNNLYKTDLSLLEDNNYNPLYGNIYNSLIGKEVGFSFKAIFKLLLLSIIYIFLGYKLFIYRKMEVNETSFKNIHVHNIVRCLTLVPIVNLSYILFINSSIISIIFIIIIILIYYFIYDLITRKSINNIKISLIYFIISLFLLSGICFIVEHVNNKDIKDIIKYEDIDKVSVVLDSNNDYYYKNNKEKVYTNNKELINILVNNLNNDYIDNSYYLPIYFKTNNNKVYKSSVRLSISDYNKVMLILSRDKVFTEYYKDFNYNKVFAIKIGNKVFNNSKDIIKLLDKVVDNLSLQEFYELNNKYNHIDDKFVIKLYTYNNHDIREITINSYIDYRLLNMVTNMLNKELEKELSIVIPNNYYVNYSNSYIKDSYEIEYNIIDYSKEEIYNFMLKEIDKEVDMKLEYISLNINLNNKEYIFTTNNIKGFKELMDKLRKEYDKVDTHEYKY